MVESRTARMRLVQWSSGTDSPQRVDFNETFLNIETLAAIDQQGTLNDRPNPNKAGMYYFATDTGTLYRSDGTSWAVVGASVLSQLVRPARTDAVAHTVQGLASQTADLKRVLNNGNVIYQRVRSNGDFIHGPLRVSQAGRTTTGTETVPTHSATTVDNSSSGMWGLTLSNTTGNTAGFLRGLRGGSEVFSISSTGVITTPTVNLTSEPSNNSHATTKKYVDDKIGSTVYPLNGSQLSGVLPVAKGGTGGTTQTTARSGIGAAASATTFTAGTGLSGGGTLGANRTFSVNFWESGGTNTGGTNGASDSAARADHMHNLAGSTIYGTLPVANGGTGRSSITSGNYVIGAGTAGVTSKTPADVRADIGAATSGHGHALTDANITGTLPVSQGGTGATTAAAARSSLAAASNAIAINTGNGLTGGGNLTASRTLSVQFAGSGSANTVARSDHKHAFSEILNRLSNDQLPAVTLIPAGSNLDSYTSDGVFYQSTQSNIASDYASENYPEKTAGLLVVYSGSSMVHQFYQTYTPGNAKLYTRTRHNTSWGAWTRMADVDDIAALANVYASKSHGHRLTDSNITGILPVNQGGTGRSNVAEAREVLGVPWAGRAINAGAGLSGGGNLTADRTLQVVFEGSGTATTAARSDHNHNLAGSSIVGVLPVEHGGTGAYNAGGARTNLHVPSRDVTLTAGAGLTGGGDLSLSRTFAVDFSSGTEYGAHQGTGTKVSRFDHQHDLSGSRITGNLPWDKNSVPIPLGTEDLNTLTSTAVYHQEAHANATTARNYPATTGGLLEVTRVGTVTYQTYTEYHFNSSLWRRSRIGTGGWYPWKRMAEASDLEPVEVAIGLASGHVQNSVGFAPTIFREGRKRTLYGSIVPSSGGVYASSVETYTAWTIPAVDRPRQTVNFIGVGGGFSPILTVRFSASQYGPFVFGVDRDTPWVAFDGMSWFV